MSLSGLSRMPSEDFDGTDDEQDNEPLIKSIKPLPQRSTDLPPPVSSPGPAGDDDEQDEHDTDRPSAESKGKGRAMVDDEETEDEEDEVRWDLPPLSLPSRSPSLPRTNAHSRLCCSRMTMSTNPARRR